MIKFEKCFFRQIDKLSEPLKLLFSPYMSISRHCNTYFGCILLPNNLNVKLRNKSMIFDISRSFFDSHRI